MPRCPVCDTPVDLTVVKTPPFCSDRCRLVDLGRWLDESYAVPERRRADGDDGEAADGEFGSGDGVASDPDAEE